MAGLDSTDCRILQSLQTDASQSLADIAKQVNLSQNACWYRIKHLEEDGIIVKRVALLDPTKLGMGVTVFVLAPHTVGALRGCECGVFDAGNQSNHSGSYA